MNSDVNEIENAVVSCHHFLQLLLLLSMKRFDLFSPELLISFFFFAYFCNRDFNNRQKSQVHCEKSQEQTSRLYSAMDEGIDGIRIIKAFNAVSFIVNRFKLINLHHQKLITRTFRKKDLSPLNETIEPARLA